MEQAYTRETSEVLKYFNVTEAAGLSSAQVAEARNKYGSNCKCPIPHVAPWRTLTKRSSALPEEPPTPLWQLVLEQFKDQLVLILLGSAAISFVLALFEESDDWTAFVDPVVVRCMTILRFLRC
jgi:Ca2+ transporting ATPase